MGKRRKRVKNKGDKAKKIVLLDVGTVWHMRFGTETQFDVHQLYGSHLESVFSDTLHFGLCNLPEGLENDFLRSYIMNVERSIAEILRKYTLRESLFWSRRIAPLNFLNVGELTLVTYRGIQSLAIFKYSSYEENMTVLPGDGIIHRESTAIPQYISGVDIRGDAIPDEVLSVVSDMYSVEVLSAIHVFAAQVYRRFNKGCSLSFSQEWEMGFACPGNKEQNTLIELYDARLSNNTLLSNAGTSIHYADEPKSLVGFSFGVNIDHRMTVPLVKNGKTMASFKSNYVPGLLDLSAYYTYLSIFADEFQEHYGFTVDEFVAFIDGLSYRLLLMFRDDVFIQFHLLQRAYVETPDLSVILDDAANFGRERFTFFTTTELHGFRDACTLIADRLIVKMENRDDIDLWTGGPRPVFYQLSGDSVVVDYSGIPSLLQSMALPIGRMSGETGNRRSRVFEDQVHDHVVTHFGEGSYWIHSREISTLEGQKKEIDATLILGNLLFIFECKAINVSLAFDRGDKEAVDYRIRKCNEALAEVDAKADFLSRNHDRLTIGFPDAVRYIVPVVVSPHSEYIWELDDDLFINKDIPRICTVADISGFAEIKRATLLEKTFVREIRGD